jgi:hypothetical protein
MTHRYRTMLGTLVAVFALGALASASASAALPEFSPKSHIKFTGTFGGGEIREPSGSYSCSTGSMSGETANGNEVAKVHIKFVCKGFCTSHGEKLGTWETSELKGRLGYVNKTKKEVGLLLEPVTGAVSECEYFAAPAKVLGSIIGKLTPVNVSTTNYTLTYEQVEAGVQSIRHFEGEELLHTLELLPSGFTKPRTLGLTGTMSLTMAAKTEIVA